MMFRNSKNFIQGNAMEGLDDLARVTVSNDNEFQDDVCIFILNNQYKPFHSILLDDNK